MKHRIGKHLESRRIAAEGYAYFAINPGALSDPIIDAFIYGEAAIPRPCPYTRHWKANAWWRGYMKAYSEAIERDMAKTLARLTALAQDSNTYQGVDR